MQLSTAQYLLQYFINLPSPDTEGATPVAVLDNTGVFEPGQH